MGLNIAMVTPWAVRCGIYSYSRSLAETIANLGHDVYIIRLPRFGVKTPEILQTVVDSVPVDKVDLVHVQHEYGLYQNLEKTFFYALKRLGKPLITTMHSAGAWEVDRIIADTSTRIIVHNEFCFRRFSYPNTGIIPHGASPLKSPPPPREECKKSLGIDPRTQIVGYLGFISSYKGLEQLIEAMIKIPKAGLLIGGGWHTERETEYTFKLKEYTLKMLPNRCRWLGFVSDEDLSRVYGAMDLFCYPSRFMTESGALLAALSHGKAVITSHLRPTREKAKLGALMTFKSVKDLRRKIKRLLKDDDARRKLEEGAKKYCENNSWKSIATKHLILYRSLLNGDQK